MGGVGHQPSAGTPGHHDLNQKAKQGVRHNQRAPDIFKYLDGNVKLADLRQLSEILGNTEKLGTEI